MLTFFPLSLISVFLLGANIVDISLVGTAFRDGASDTEGGLMEGRCAKLVRE